MYHLNRRLYHKYKLGSKVSQLWTDNSYFGPFGISLQLILPLLTTLSFIPNTLCFIYGSCQKHQERGVPQICGPRPRNPDPPNFLSRKCILPLALENKILLDPPKNGDLNLFWTFFVIFLANGLYPSPLKTRDPPSGCIWHHPIGEFREGVII